MKVIHLRKAANALSCAYAFSLLSSVSADKRILIKLGTAWKQGNARMGYFVGPGCFFYGLCQYNGQEKFGVFNDTLHFSQSICLNAFCGF